MKLANLGHICPYCQDNMCCGAMSLHAKVTEDRLAAITNGQCPDCGGTGRHDESANGRCITCNGTGAWDKALAALQAEVERLRAELEMARGAVQAFRSAFEHAEGRNATARADIAHQRAALAEARALLSEAGPLMFASAGWPGRRTTWLEENRP